MLDFVFDIPLWIAGPALIGSLIVFAVGGLLLVRRGKPSDAPGGDAGIDGAGTREPTLGRLRAGIAIVGLAATAYTLFPVVWASPCS